MSWRDIQEKTFTRWCNDYLADRGIRINNLKDDFKSGKNLVNLLEIISGKSLGRYNKHPVLGVQKCENIDICLKFLKAQGIQLVNIGPVDIVDGNVRLILGLIWTLILRYEIQAGDKNSAANDLLKWVQSKIPEYGIKGFTKDWNDGRAICALTNAMKPGLCPGHQSLDSSNGLANCEKGIGLAERNLGIDRLIYPEEMNNKKVDKLAMMTYIAQFRNIPDNFLASDASRCVAYGPGLTEGLAGEQTGFTVEIPEDSNGKLRIDVEGPKGGDAKVRVVPKGGGKHEVTYSPTTPGLYKISVTLDGEHIPGSIFMVEVLEEESLGGEGKIRVFYSTTSSSEKTKSDIHHLKDLLTRKKVHLREDFEPWCAVDLLSKPDRDAVFRKAGTKVLPIVFIDDKMIGDYDKCVDLEEKGQLDKLLKMDQQRLVSIDVHMARLKGAKGSGRAQRLGGAVSVTSTSSSSEAKAAPKPAKKWAPVKTSAQAAPSKAPVKKWPPVNASTGLNSSAGVSAAAPVKKFCPECGAKRMGTGKFCAECGNKF